MVVFAPSLAAWMHWLAPFPPKPVKNLEPWMVSPAFGSLGAWLSRTKITGLTSAAFNLPLDLYIVGISDG